MSIDEQNVYFRAGAGVVIYNDNNQVLMFTRAGHSEQEYGLHSFLKVGWMQEKTQNLPCGANYSKKQHSRKLTLLTFNPTPTGLAMNMTNRQKIIYSQKEQKILANSRNGGLQKHLQT